MILSSLAGMVTTELRLRSRRVATLVALLSVTFISWLMVPDPTSGMTMMAINDARVLYDSRCLAIAGATLMSTLLSLAGFYLVRGRMRDDLVLGVSAALASTPIGGLELLIGRWLGAVAYLFLLATLCMLSLLVLHTVRSDSAIVLQTYLEHFVLILTPEIVFIASISVLFEAWSPLMGKVGDVLYFLLWAMTLGFAGHAGSHMTSSLPLALWSDFSGIGVVIYGLHHLEHTTRISIGVASFDASLTPVMIVGDFWTVQMVLIRFCSALAALLPLLLAALLFHRFSPDRISSDMYRSRRSVLTIGNRLLSPAAAFVRPVYAIAAYCPGLWAGVLADTALLVSSNPVSVLVMALVIPAGLIAPIDVLPGVVAGAVACWGILISESAIRDSATGIEPMTAYLPGGATRRYLRQLLSSLLFGLLMVLPIAVRWLTDQPLRCLTLISGLFALSAIANLLGRVTNTSRTFIALLLFDMYLSIEVNNLSVFDTVGILGVATLRSILAVTLFGSGAVLISVLLAHVRRQAAC